MKAVRHPVGEVDGGQWLACHVCGVENDQVAPIFLFAVHSHEQKSLAFGGPRRAWDKIGSEE